MPIDVTEFHPNNVVDTCAVWHLLSSEFLYAAAIRRTCKFCITRFVRYECLDKPRSNLNKNQQILRERLQKRIASGDFPAHYVALEDLLDGDIVSRRQNLGKGELTTIIFAKLTGQSVMTDDQRARKLAETVIGQKRTQTTSHLFGWLFYIGEFVDHDKDCILSQHANLGCQLRPHLQQAYELAMKAKLLERPTN